MQKLFAAPTVLILVFGAVSLAAPANAATTSLFPPNQTEGQSI
jgi:hypothetical protein